MAGDVSGKRPRKGGRPKGRRNRKTEIRDTTGVLQAQQPRLALLVQGVDAEGVPDGQRAADELAGAKLAEGEPAG